MKCARSESNKREEKFKKRLKPNANSLINQQKVNKHDNKITKVDYNSIQMDKISKNDQNLNQKSQPYSKIDDIF